MSSPVTLSETENSNDPLRLIDVDYVQFYVGNAKQAAYFYAQAFGFEIKSRINSVVRPFTDLVRHQFVQLALFLVLVFSCCVMSDTNLFVLLAIMMLVMRR